MSLLLLGCSGTQTAAPAPPAGATHRWTMNNAGVSGATITDSAGSLNGTSHNGVTSATTLASQDRAFDGTGYITLPSCPLASIGSWSIAFFGSLTTPTNTGGGGGSQTLINWAIDANNGIRIASDENAFQEPNLSTEVVVSVVKAGVNVGVLSASTNANFPLTPGRRDHIGITYDNTTIKIYVNGEAWATTSLDTFGVSNENNIGTRSSDGTATITGNMGIVSVYATPLTASQMRQLHKADLYQIAHLPRMTEFAAGASNTSPISYSDLSLTQFGYGFQYANGGQGGSTWADWSTNFATWALPFYDANADICLMTMQNTNDIDTGTSGAASYALAQIVSAQWKALGANAKYYNLAAWGWSTTNSAPNLVQHQNYNTAAQADAAASGYLDTYNISGLNTGVVSLSLQDSADNNHLRGDNPGFGQYRVRGPYATGVQAVWSAA